MRSVDQTSKALRALAKALVDNEHRTTELERERLTVAVFGAILPNPTSLPKGMITWNGETCSIREWSKRLGINYFTLFNRLKRGWGIGMAFTKPAKPSNRCRAPRNHKEI
jgi:hypothetical protein